MELEFMNLVNKNKNRKRKSDILSRIWSQRCSSHPIELQKIMDNDDNAFKYYYSLLFTDNRDIYWNNPVYKKKAVHKKKKLNFLKYISNASEKVLNQIYTKINYMKDRTKELNKMNTLGLQKTSKSYFRTNRPKSSNFNLMKKKNRVESASTNYRMTTTLNFNLSKSRSLSKNELQNNNNLSTSRNDTTNNNLYMNTYENTKMNTKENTNLNASAKRRNISSAFNRNKKVRNILSYSKSKLPLKSSLNYKLNTPSNLLEDKGEEKFRNLINIDVPKLYATNKRKHLNLSRLNDIYRVQMNKTFGKYDIEKHLKELNKIQRDDMSVRKDMEKIKKRLNQKIDDRCQGLYYKKEYLKLKEENEKINRAKSAAKKPFPKQIPFNILFRNKNKQKVKVFPNGYKIRAFYDYCVNCEKIQKAKNKELLLKFGADLLFSHLHSKDYELLNNALDEIFNVLEVDPIVKYIEDFKNEKPNKDKDELSERINNYFPVLIETEKKIQKFEQNQIFKRKKVHEVDNVLEKIDETKKLLSIN